MFLTFEHNMQTFCDHVLEAMRILTARLSNYYITVMYMLVEVLKC